MVRLENDPFLNELTRLYKATENTGTIYITYKQYIDVKEPAKKKRKIDHSAEAGEACCLIRAQSPHKKISTVLRGKDVIKFSMALTTIQKAHMDALKKREKRKRGPRAKKE